MKVLNKRSFPAQPMTISVESEEDLKLIEKAVISAIGPSKEEDRVHLVELLKMLK